MDLQKALKIGTVVSGRVTKQAFSGDDFFQQETLIFFSQDHATFFIRSSREQVVKSSSQTEQTAWRNSEPFSVSRSAPYPSIVAYAV